MPRLPRAALARASLSQRLSHSIQHTQSRHYSSQPPSATSNFYKTFTRPVGKCALLAVLVYQLVYFGWSKLEVDEIKHERQAEIIKLEAQVRSLHAAAERASSSASASGSGSGVGGEGEAKSTGSSWWRWK